jgi:hypothetical protein
MADKLPTEVMAAATDPDRIVAYLNGKVEHLSEHEQKMYERYDAADNLIRQWGDRRAKKMLGEKYGLTLRQAHKVVMDAKYIFGSKLRIDKAYYRQMVIDKIMRALTGMEQDLFRENEKGDMIAISDAKLMKAYTDTLGELRRTLGDFNDLDSDEPDWDAIGAVPVNITSSPEDIGVERVKKVNELRTKVMREMFDGAEDVDYTEEK